MKWIPSIPRIIPNDTESTFSLAIGYTKIVVFLRSNYGIRYNQPPITQQDHFTTEDIEDKEISIAVRVNSEIIRIMLVFGDFSFTYMIPLLSYVKIVDKDRNLGSQMCVGNISGRTSQ